MASIETRNASIEDIKHIANLMCELGYPTDYETLIKRFKAFISHEGYGVAVGCDNKVVAGFVAWSNSKLFVSNTTRFRIEGLIVDEKYRGLGIGKALMEHVEKIAKLNKPSIVDLTSGKRREKDGTHDFYKKIGYENQGPMSKVYFRKRL